MKAKPIRASTWIGVVNSTQPRTDGPMTIPATISSITAGTRSRGANPSRSGTAKATTATTNRSDNDTSGVIRPSLRASP